MVLVGGKGGAARVYEYQVSFTGDAQRPITHSGSKIEYKGHLWSTE